MVESLRNFLDAMGVDWVLWLLLVLSVGSLTIIIERAVYFRRNFTPAERIEGILRTHLGRNELSKALESIAPLPGMEARVVSEGLREMHRGADAVEEILAGTIASERVRHDQFLSILGTLGNNAPFIGLFGTVVGIVGAFRNLESAVDTSDASKNQLIMGSISEALVATAVGLFVAIPAVVGFNAFKNMIRKRASNADALARLVIAHLRSKAS